MKHIFDIETRPKSGLIAEFTKPFNPSDVKLGNLKDEAKIKDKIIQAEEDYNTNLVEKAALNPATSEICAIGIHLEDSKEVIILDGEEKQILTEFWNIHGEQEGYWCSYSGSNDKSNFDVRHILHRSWVNGVRVLYGTVLNGNISKQFLDLAQVFLAGAPYPSYCSADMCGKQLGIIGTKNDAGLVSSKQGMEDEIGITGKNFHTFLDGDEEQRQIALEYLRNDLAIERGIANVIL